MLQPLLAVILLTFSSFPAMAFYAQIIPKDTQRLFVSNPFADAAYVYLNDSFSEARSPLEHAYLLQPQSKIEIDLKNFQSFGYLQIRSSEKVLWSLTAQGPYLPLTLPSTNWNTGASSPSKLILTNPQPRKNTVVIHDLMGFKKIVSFNPFELQQMNLPAGRFEIESDLRVIGYQVEKSSSKIQIHNLIEGQARSSPQNPVGGQSFIFSNQDKTESFVVRIEDPEMIEITKKILLEKDRPHPRILIADIEPQTHLDPKIGGYNWDAFRPSKSPWNWKVQKIYGYAFFASQECDGSPSLVEDLNDLWIQRSPRICFWNYQVSEILP
ncbi:MAG: hypothetical protein LW875_09430 [Proteobacteria bacterium]|jgi:hypothetical protein|nr:hypothetical protein [Pseudomonadota bacterium]